MAFHAQQPIAPTYGYCDSYFVESHDDDNGYFARAAIDRERTRQINKNIQRQYAAELSQLTADEYQDDVLDHMEAMEAETMPDVNSIDIQTEIEWFMRPYLLDFLLEAHHAFQLLPETLFLACNLLDRYCSRRVVYKRHYQLVGCAALLIAAKYGDRKDRVPTIRELKSMCCSLYDDDMFTQMEWHVLQTLNWMVGHPTVPSFLEMAVSEEPTDPQVEHMSLYLSEIALYHREFISVMPSVLARSSLALARLILGRPQNEDSLSWSARYDSKVVMDLSNVLSEPSQALFRKYSSPHLSSVSTVVDAFLQHQAMVAQQRARAVQVQVSQPQDSPMMVDSFHLAPQTPQKPAYPMNIVAGVMTPPITPDKGFGGSEHGFGVSQQNLMPQSAACAPTPPSCSGGSRYQYPVAQYHSQPSQGMYIH
ncbi:G1/S-specific cyclin CLN2 [Myriangium duriaei CBS 260.36]|uniref:G1/S-specific cyclin CLN2 n=1 Tax=Myriangium duriaei CBS 260.36 TaxID=1168546 RepID=A0A9P4IUQ8_9PEZI|nr:G1/S-specific cyclin CLN2 [Myriangium duriaei CBS 260.36]